LLASTDHTMRVRELRTRGLSQRTIARELGISPRTVGRIIGRLDQESPPTPGRSGEDPPTLMRPPVRPRADLPPGAHPRPSNEIEHRQSATPTTPSSEPPQEPGLPFIGEGRHEDPAEVGAETTAPPPRGEALPHFARQLYDFALRICQVEAQQLRDTEVRVCQAEEVLSQAMQAFHAVRAEPWKMMRVMTQSAGELLQATEQLLQLLSGEGRKIDEEVPPTLPRASHGIGERHNREPQRLPPWRHQTHPLPETGQPPPQT
jgi:hypothetical protein